MTRLIPLLVTLVACGDAPEPDTGTDTEADTDTEVDTEAYSDDIVFTAFMSDNDGHSQDEAGDFDDWLTVGNVGSSPVLLAGWQLTDDHPEDVPWVFPPDTTLQPGEELLVWCDDEGTEGPLHADFRLSADGETLTLLDPDGHVVQEVVVPALATDQAYVRQTDGTWAVE